MAGSAPTSAGPASALIEPSRRRALRVWTLTTVGLLAALAGTVVAHHRLDVRGTAVVALIAADLAYAAVRLPWPRLLAGRRGDAWLVAASVVDVCLVTAALTMTGHGASPLFVLYALTTVLFAAVHPPGAQALLLGVTVASYLGVLALDGWEAGAGATAVRLGGLAVVAAVAAFLSRELLGQVRAHGEARAESESRAALLATVAGAARTMSTLDAGQVLATVVESALDMGFDGAELCLFDEPSGTWHVAHRRGPEPDPAPARPADAGVAGLVHARRATVVLDEHSGWPATVRPALEAGYRFMIATPVWSGGDLVGALVAGSLVRRAPHPHEVECVDLLAAHAGAALHNARLYAERQEFEARLAHQAFHDSLTGLPNRSLFLDRLEQALARARRDGEAVGVLFMDLDRFKAVNDSLGHEVGDELLSAVAQRLNGSLRPGDTLARYGGDEFTVLLDKLRSDDDGIDVADRLLRALAEPFSLSGREVRVSASIGVSFAKPPFTGEADPLREADLAMYRAKERGKSRWEVFRSEMNAQALRRLELEGELRHGLDRGELFLAYQPVVELASRRVTGVEALVRWRHPARGVVEPAEFVPLAEKAGLASRLGDWVLDEACRQAQDWRRRGLPVVEVAVNVGAEQLRRGDLAERVALALEASGLPADRLVVDIGEALVAAQADLAGAVVEDLGRLGVRVALDDVGRGRSSLRQLSRVGVHAVKVDRIVVAGAADDVGDRAVLRSLVTLASQLGIVVVAEGVETADQLDAVADLGCTLAQGYWLCRPVGAAAVADLLRGPLEPVGGR